MATRKITYAPHFEEESRQRFKKYSEIASGLSAARRIVELYEQKSALIDARPIGLTEENPRFRSWYRLAGAKGVPYAVRVIIEIMPEDEQGVIEVIVHAVLPRDDDTYETHVAELWKQYRTPM